MSDRLKSRAWLVNGALAATATIVVVLAAEPLLRMRYVEPAPRRPAVDQVQRFLRLDPNVGFTWLPDITPDRNIRFDNADVQAPPLSTDEFGVINSPEAIALRRSGHPIDVVGLGDSFMEMAAPDFHRAFAAQGLAYYSLAIHRHAPPHYANMYRAHGAAIRPRVVVVGLFENDFAETADFEAWQRSGLDWFAFHSGTWCGPPLRETSLGRLFDAAFPGYQGLAQVIRSRVRGERMSVAGPGYRHIERVSNELRRIASSMPKDGSALWLLLIPSKPTARGEATAESRAFDRVVADIGTEVAGVVDLRPVFQQHADPASLYYVEDGHWNPAGVELAARELLARLTTSTVQNESRDD